MARAIWWLTSRGRFELRRHHEAQLAPGEARIRFAYVGICGSDLSKFEGRRELQFPVTMGHEFVATVDAVGESVTEVSAGQAVTSDLNFRCGTCDQCRAGRSHLCAQGQIGRFSNRGLASTADIVSSYLRPISAPIGPQLALAEPLSCVLHAKAWATPARSDRVLIVGAGSLGLCLAFAMTCDRDSPPFQVIDIDADRLARLARPIGGAGETVSEPEGVYDAVFDLSGSEDGLRRATTAVRPGGRLCTMSHLDGYSDASFLLAALTRRDVTFTVSYLNGNGEHLDTATRLLARCWDGPWNDTIEIVPGHNVQRAFSDRRSSPYNKTILDVNCLSA